MGFVCRQRLVRHSLWRGCWRESRKGLPLTSALGHELPRHLAERAAVMPPKAAAPSRDQGGRGGPTTEVADLHSITSSARDRNDSGIVSPSALAVVRLTTRSNSVGCSTGMLPGLAPRRILSTKSAVRRNSAGKFGPHKTAGLHDSASVTNRRQPQTERKGGDSSAIGVNESIFDDIKRVRLIFESFECGSDVLCAPDAVGRDFEVERTGCGLKLVLLQNGSGIAGIKQEG